MIGPRLLFDENLSPRLVGLLAEAYPDSVHVDQAGMHGRPDADVWAYARDNNLVLVSKDNDFRQMSFLHGAPPKVIWLRIGNAPTLAAADALRKRRPEIEAFIVDAEAALLAIES